MGTIGLFLWNASGTTRYQILCQSYIALQISLQNMSTFQQGDPLSSILFVVAMEVLLINIREDNNIEGIRIDQNILY